MGLTLGAGIMAIISGILGPLGAIFDGTAGTALTVAAGVTGSLSGGSTVGIGVANHLSENVAEVCVSCRLVVLKIVELTRKNIVFKRSLYLPAT